MYEGPGRYRHHKGVLYRVLGVAREKRTGKRAVVYESLEISGSTLGADDFWQLAVEEFDAEAAPGVPRFERVSRP